MNNEFYIENEIVNINKAIEQAKESFESQLTMDDDILEFPSERDLNRFIDACNYEKVEIVKEYYSNEDIKILNIPGSDKELIKKINLLKSVMPEELHKCIGCPCLENEYPNCERCNFQESCLIGNSPYPDECTENDCYYTFNWIENNEEYIKKELELISKPPNN